VNDIEDVPALLRAEIEHFFEVYKTLEPGKQSETGGYGDVDAAWQEIEAARARATDS
jgi:inorganic pyrophosphatase